MHGRQQLTRRRRGGFSLLEVVVAVGIFAVGMMAVVGLFTPVARSVSGSAEAETAARVADALRAKLQAMPVADVIALLKKSNGTRHELTDADGRPDYDPTKDAQVLFASRDGSKIGTYADVVWGARSVQFNPDRDKYFEVALIRNETLTPLATTQSADLDATPVNPDDTAFLIAYTARLRWPMFVPEGAAGAMQVGSNPTGTVRFDHSMKQVMFFTGAVTR